MPSIEETTPVYRLKDITIELVDWRVSVVRALREPRFVSDQYGRPHPIPDGDHFEIEYGIRPRWLTDPLTGREVVTGVVGLEGQLDIPLSYILSMQDARRHSHLLAQAEYPVGDSQWGSNEHQHFMCLQSCEARTF